MLAECVVDHSHPTEQAERRGGDKDIHPSICTVVPAAAAFACMAEVALRDTKDLGFRQFYQVIKVELDSLGKEYFQHCPHSRPLGRLEE